MKIEENNFYFGRTFYSPAGENAPGSFLPRPSRAISRRAVKAELTGLENRIPDDWVQLRMF